MSPRKAAEPMEMRLVVDSGGPKEPPKDHYVRWGCRCLNGLLYPSYDVRLHKQLPFGGCGVTAPHLEDKIPKNSFGRE